MTVENGVAPYTYSWSNGSTAEDISGLTKGVYNIQVKDANGALASNSFTVRGDADPSIVTAGLRMDSYFTDSALEFPALGSAEFNGTSDYIDMGEKHIANDLGITNAFTFGAWAYQEDATYKSILTLWGSSLTARVFWFGFDSSELFHYNISLTGGDRAKNIHSVPTKEWVYVNLTYDGSIIKLYLNGSVVDTQGGSGNLDGRGFEPTQNLLIGAQNIDSLAAWYKSNLANVAIWNRALHPDEINAIMWKSYSDLNAVDKNGLQAWYALDDINGTTVPDSTGANNGTAN